MMLKLKPTKLQNKLKKTHKSDDDNKNYATIWIQVNEILLI